jgi:hypothetical protein
MNIHLPDLSFIGAIFSSFSSDSYRIIGLAILCIFIVLLYGIHCVKDIEKARIKSNERIQKRKLTIKKAFKNANLEKNEKILRVVK